MPTGILEDFTNRNPKALTLIRFKNITFTLAKRTSNEPFYSRIRDLNISWMEEKYEYSNARMGWCASFPVLALNNIQSLQRVSVSFPNRPGTKSNFEQDLANRSSLPHYKLLSDDKEQLEITVERRAEYPQFVTESEAAFKTFQEEMKTFYC